MDGPLPTAIDLIDDRQRILAKELILATGAWREAVLAEMDANRERRRVLTGESEFTRKTVRR